MLSFSFHLLNESANPVSILHKSSAEAAIVISCLITASRIHEGLEQIPCSMAMVRVYPRRFLLLLHTPPDYFFFVSELVTNRSFVHRDVGGALYAQKLCSVKMILFATTAANENVAAINTVMDGNISVLKARSRRTHRVKMKQPLAATADKIAVYQRNHR